MQVRCTETTVIVEDLRVEAHVGLHDPERDQLQTVAIDIACSLQNPPVLGDDLANSINYVPIVEEVKTLAKVGKRRLIETFAEEIAAVCFDNPHAKSVIVSIRKPNKFPGLSAVGITRTFERGR